MAPDADVDAEVGGDFRRTSSTRDDTFGIGVTGGDRR